MNEWMNAEQLWTDDPLNVLAQWQTVSVVEIRSSRPVELSITNTRAINNHLSKLKRNQLKNDNTIKPETLESGN